MNRIRRFLAALPFVFLQFWIGVGCAAGDPVEELLISLGRRGVNMDVELKDLNTLAQLHKQPEQARQLYINVKGRLEAKRARLQSVPRSNLDHALITRLAAGGLRVMTVTAHPDDENMMSGLLAFALDQGNAVFLLCLTKGEAGENPRATGLRGEALGRTRSDELRRATSVLGIEYEIAGFTNGAFKHAYPNRKFWLPTEVIAVWRETRDPQRAVDVATAQFKPDIIVTVEPNWGWTGNPEHRAAAELAGHAGARAGAQVAYAVTSDAEFTDQFDTSRASEKRSMSYWEVKIAAARHHRSQYRLPPDAAQQPERFRDLSVEHFRRVETRNEDK